MPESAPTDHATPRDGDRHPGGAVYLALAGVQVLFGAIPVAAKGAFAWLGAPGMVVVRVVGSAIVLHAIAAAAGYERVRSLRDHLELAALGLAGVVLNQALFFLGLAHTTAVNATVLGSTTVPVFTAALALSLRHERFDAFRVAGIVVAGAGALYLVNADRITFGARTLGGDLMVIGNAVFFAVFFVFSRGVLRRYRPFTVVLWTFTWGSLVVLPWGAADLARAAGGHPPAILWWLLAFIVIGTVGAYQLNTFALKKAPASLVAVFMYAQPVVAAVLAVPLLGERIGPRQIVGTLVVLLGLRLAAGRARSRNAPA